MCIYIYARKSEEKETPYHCHEKRENKMTWAIAERIPKTASWWIQPYKLLVSKLEPYPQTTAASAKTCPNYIWKAGHRQSTSSWARKGLELQPTQRTNELLPIAAIAAIAILLWTPEEHTPRSTAILSTPASSPSCTTSGISTKAATSQRGVVMLLLCLGSCETQHPWDFLRYLEISWGSSSVRNKGCGTHNDQRELHNQQPRGRWKLPPKLKWSAHLYTFEVVPHQRPCMETANLKAVVCKVGWEISSGVSFDVWIRMICMGQWVKSLGTPEKRLEII